MYTTLKFHSRRTARARCSGVSCDWACLAASGVDESPAYVCVDGSGYWPSGVERVVCGVRADRGGVSLAFAARMTDRREGDAIDGCTLSTQSQNYLTNVFVLAELPDSSHHKKKTILVIYKKCFFRISVSKKTFNLDLKKASLGVSLAFAARMMDRREGDAIDGCTPSTQSQNHLTSVCVLADVSVNSP